MTVETKFIITAAQKADLEALNKLTSLPPVRIDPRAVDATAPGVGLNLNPDADGFDAGEPVTLASKFVAPKRIVDDPLYVSKTPAMVAYLLDLPFAILEDETIHAPEPPVDI